jgi:glycosyltransferase involved in cell wall biosynthesis
VTAAPLFTIFTPTYNRAHILHRAFDSLRAQTLRDFEWLVVDDGSTDGTDKLVAEWMQSADFPVRYLFQEHAHKHIAHNRALAEARGRFFSCLDSDDALLPDALEKLAYHWNTIPESERHAFIGVDALCCDQDGKIVGDRYPREPLDATLREQKYVYRLRGEKWGVGLTEILRRYPFPEIPGNNYVPEGIVWLEIAKKFKSRAVNEVVRIYYFDEAEPGVTVAKKRNMAAHAVGRWHFYLWLINNDLEYFFRSPMPFLKGAVMLPIVGWYSAHTLRDSLRGLKRWSGKLMVLAALPLAGLLYLLDKAGTRGRTVVSADAR